jgi:hypothetical protein
VLVRVVASSLNSVDASVASGRLHGMMECRFPVVLGKDLAGALGLAGTAAVDSLASADPGPGRTVPMVIQLASAAAVAPDQLVLQHRDGRQHHGPQYPAGHR